MSRRSGPVADDERLREVHARRGRPGPATAAPRPAPRGAPPAASQARRPAPGGQRPPRAVRRVEVAHLQRGDDGGQREQAERRATSRRRGHGRARRPPSRPGRPSQASTIAGRPHWPSAPSTWSAQRRPSAAGRRPPCPPPSRSRGSCAPDEAGEVRVVGRGQGEADRDRRPAARGRGSRSRRRPRPRAAATSASDHEGSRSAPSAARARSAAPTAPSPPARSPAHQQKKRTVAACAEGVREVPVGVRDVERRRAGAAGAPRPAPRAAAPRARAARRNSAAEASSPAAAAPTRTSATVSMPAREQGREQRRRTTRRRGSGTACACWVTLVGKRSPAATRARLLAWNTASLTTIIGDVRAHPLHQPGRDQRDERPRRRAPARRRSDQRARRPRASTTPRHSSARRARRVRRADRARTATGARRAAPSVSARPEASAAAGRTGRRRARRRGRARRPRAARPGARPGATAIARRRRATRPRSAPEPAAVAGAEGLGPQLDLARAPAGRREGKRTRRAPAASTPTTTPSATTRRPGPRRPRISTSSVAARGQIAGTRTSRGRRPPLGARPRRQLAPVQAPRAKASSLPRATSADGSGDHRCSMTAAAAPTRAAASDAVPVAARPIAAGVYRAESTVIADMNRWPPLT